jgi:hypothetical protein
MENEIKNAIIHSATISNDAHGILTAFIFLDFGDGGIQGFGGYALYVPPEPDEKNHDIRHSTASHFIWRVMETVGVTNWEDLPGKPIRAKGDHIRIQSVGHIIHNKWFCPAEEYAARRQA